MLRRIPVVLVMVGGLVLVAGCGEDDPDDPSSACTPENMCYVDFPCSFTSACLVGEPTKMSSNESYPCEAVCGPCCSGGGCSSGSIDCEEGTVCAYPGRLPTDFLSNLWNDNPTPACTPIADVCGGPDAIACPERFFCEFAGLLCGSGGSYSNCEGGYSEGFNCGYARAGGYGNCRIQPNAAMCPEDDTPVCGCDGVSYANDCQRMAAGVPLAKLGNCDGMP